MQKVSKQSLAMIALSILLAISIALTFTFAGLSANKTAKGTITFSGNVTVAYDADTTTANGTIVFTPNYTDSTVTTDNKQFTIGGSDAYVQIEITVEGGTGVTVQVKDPFATSPAFANITSNSATFKSANKVTKDTSYNVDDLVKATFDATEELTNCTITIKVSADTRNAF